MAVVINVDGFDINFPSSIDKRLIVDTVDGSFPSLTTLDTGYNYENMIVWVRDEKAFYYLIDIPTSDGAVASDWAKFSGGATGGCAKSGYVSGTSFTGDPATATVTFVPPYQSASYSVAVTQEGYAGETVYVYTVVDKTENGFNIIVDSGQAGPIGATAMWITNCWDGSGLFNGVGGGGASVAIDLEEIAFGTGTGITSSDVFTFNNTNTSLILGFDNTITDSRSSAIIGGTGNTINSSTKDVFIDSNLITSAKCTNIEDSFYSSIQSSLNSKICGSTASSIITSYNTTLRSSCYSTIMDSYGGNYAIGDPGLFGSCFSTLIGTHRAYIINGSRYSSMINTCGGCIVDSRYASIFLSRESCIVNTGVGGQHRNLILNGECNIIYKSRNSSIINSEKSCIFTTTVGYESFSNIIGGQFNKICNSCASNSIGGQCNRIYDSCFSNSIGGQCNRIYDSCSSGIIGSFKSSMTASLADEYGPICAAKFNSILYSRCSSIIGNCYNSIISSSGSSILSSPNQGGPFQNPCHSLIIGGVGHEINGPKNSIILGGSNLKLCKSVQGGIGGFCDGFDNVVIAPSFIGRGSFALNIKTASNNISLDYEDFTLIAYPTISGMTVSLPPCEPGPISDNMRGRIYVIKKDGSSTQSIVYISPNGNDTIDGYSDSIELINPWDYNILQSDGVNLWIKLGGAVGLNL